MKEKNVKAEINEYKAEKKKEKNQQGQKLVL